MDDKEFMELLAKSDCTDTLIKMAETPWQKQVAVEFVLQDKKINANKHDLNVVKKIAWAIFSLTAIASVASVINTILNSGISIL